MSVVSESMFHVPDTATPSGRGTTFPSRPRVGPLWNDFPKSFAAMAARGRQGGQGLWGKGGKDDLEKSSHGKDDLEKSSHRARGIAAVHVIVILLVVALLVLLVSRRTGGPKANEASLIATGPVTSTPPGVDYNQRQQLLVRGQAVYNRYCVGCHGAKGDGNGPAAARLLVKPRDFTVGAYKFRSTIGLPTEADLHRTLTHGLPGASMPAFPLLPEQDRTAVIQFIKAFYAEWDERAASIKVVQVPKAPADLHVLADKLPAERVQRGRLVYLAMGCIQCHGADGAGDKAARGIIPDEKLGGIRPRNLTRGPFRAGHGPQDIYRTFYSGIGGLMPAFDEFAMLAACNDDVIRPRLDSLYPQERAALEPLLNGAFKKTDLVTKALSGGALTRDESAQLQQRAEGFSWDLVAYVMSLRQGAGKPMAPPPVENVVTPKTTEDEF